MDIKVSIIIPVYNSQQFLPMCLDSVMNQSLKELEVILINDASTDNSLEIMRHYQERFPDTIRIIDAAVNSGAGGARNLGIEAAGGQYIGFVDSDDQIAPDMYEHLYATAIQGDYDVVDSGYYMQSNDTAILHTSDDMAGILDSDKRSRLIVSGGYIVSKIFRRSLFTDMRLRFRCNSILEDSDFLTYVYATIGSIGNVKEILYYYRDNGTSLSKVMELERYYRSIYTAMDNIYRKTSDLNNYETIRNAVEYELIQMYSYGINRCLKEYIDKECEDCVTFLDNIRQLKTKIVQGDYTNPYVETKIDTADINIMKLNDDSPERLLSLIVK